MASYALQHVLRRHGVDSTLMKGKYKGCYHWWLVIDNVIVDITATQFGIKDKVYITHKNSLRYKGREHKAKSFAMWPRRLWPTKHITFFRGISLRQSVSPSR